MNAIITPIEVIAKAGYEKNFDPNIVKNYIHNAEYRHLAKEDSFFGASFYQALVDDLIVFSVWKSDIIYNENDCVLYGSFYFKCLVNNTTGATPADTNNWQPTNKFQTPKYQELWDYALHEFLALVVRHSSTFKNAYRETSKGVMRNEDQSSKPAEFAGVKMLKDELMADLNIVRDRMDKFLRKNANTYPLYKGNSICSREINRSNSFGLYIKKDT